MVEVTRAKAPWHLWVVGVLSTLFNSGGAIDYTMTQTRNMDYLTAGAKSVNMPVEVFIEHFSSFPMWADAAWALGVWGAIAGSILLLFRSRFAVQAFTVSLIGLALTTLYQFVLIDLPPELKSNFNIAFSIAIWAVILALIFYSRRMSASGVLR
jgi:hypothetical protein